MNIWSKQLIFPYPLFSFSGVGGSELEPLQVSGETTKLGSKSIVKGTVDVISSDPLFFYQKIDNFHLWWVLYKSELSICVTEKRRYDICSKCFMAIGTRSICSITSFSLYVICSKFHLLYMSFAQWLNTSFAL